MRSPRGWRAEGESEERLQLRERLVGILHLDGDEPELPGGLQVPTDVVQEGRLAGLDAELGEGVAVDPGVGLAEAEDVRLHEDVEAVAQGAGAVALAAPVVGEGGGLEPALADPLDRGQHRRPRGRAGGDPLHHGPRLDPGARSLAVGLEVEVEALEVELAALEPRPRTSGAALDHDPVHEARRDRVLALEARDRGQGRVEHDPAEVEDHGGELPLRHGGGPESLTPGQDTVSRGAGRRSPGDGGGMQSTRAAWAAIALVACLGATGASAAEDRPN